MNLAFAREIPAIGSVIAMELEPRRRPKDTFPTYMSFFLEKGAAGALSTGFLPPRFSVVDINPELAVKGQRARSEGGRAARRAMAPACGNCRMPSKSRIAAYGNEMAGYDDFYDTAHKLLSDTRWPDAFKIAEADRKRYGNTPVGISCILARNVLAQDAGTHYIHICHPGWDHHVQIWDRKAASNHYVLCNEFDPALRA